MWPADGVPALGSEAQEVAEPADHSDAAEADFGGCAGLAITTLQVRFEQGEFARSGAVRQPGLKHHFGLLQAFQCHQASICLAEVVLVLELMHQPGD